jgi:tetratricopeptide (TPR) repeat protein
VRVIALVLSIVFTAPTAANERALQLINEWIAAVDEHTPGQTDAALARIAAWTMDDLELMRGWVEVFAEVPANNRDRSTRRRAVDLAAVQKRTKDIQARGDFDRFRKRAVILHTDAAILASPPVVVTRPAVAKQWPHGLETQPRVDVLSNDGRVENFQRANPHWEYAMSLLESLPAKAARDPMVARWYRSVGAYFAVNRRYADAMRHFAQARLVVPEDPLVLYGEACLQETLGAPRIQDYVRVTVLQNGLSIRGISSRETHLNRAESMLRKAIAAAPHFVEANLRLGRVLTQLRRPAEGLTFLKAAIAESRDATVSYYAHLFAGDASLSLGRTADAQGSYEDALGVYPNAQAARLGLSAALHTAGDRPAAQAALLPTLLKPPPTNTADDPWWDYYFGDAATVDRLLGELREPLSTRTPQ